MSKPLFNEASLAKFLRFGVYLTALVPLLVFKDFLSTFHFGKVLIFRSLVEILGVAYLVLILKNRSYLPKKTKVFWAFFLFTLAFTLTTLTSVLRYPSFWGTLERMGGLWTFWHYFLYFIILTSVFTKKEHWQKLLNLTIFAGVLSAFYGFAQKTNLHFFVGAGGRARIFGTIGNAALFAGYELFTVFLSLIMFLRPENNKNYKIFYALAFVISSVAILMTAVRGSMLGYAIGLIVFAFMWTRYKQSHVGKSIFKTLAILVILFVSFSLLFKDSSFIKNSKYLSRVTNLSPTSLTVQTRFWAWEAGLKGWIENPKTILLGWGPENFNIPFSKYFNPKFFVGIGSETLFDRAHNMFVEILVTMGVVGLLAYLNIFVSLFSSLRKIFKNKDFLIYGAGFASMMIAYIIHNFFIFDTASNFLVFFTVIGFLSYLSINHQGEVLLAKPLIANSSLVKWLGLILIIFVLLLTYKTNILPAKANYIAARAFLIGRKGNFNLAFEKYKEALSYNVPGKYEYRHNLAQYLVGPGGPDVQEEKVRQAHEYALIEVDKNIKENPVDYSPYLYGTVLNIMLGAVDPKSPYNDIALQYALKALEFSPTFIRTYSLIGQIYLNKEEYPKALEYFQKAVDLNSTAGISYWYLGSAKIESGDLGGVQDLEKALLGEGRFVAGEQDYLKLVSKYVRQNNFAGVAKIYEKIVAKYKTNAQHFASLAMAYAKLGRINDAVAMTRKAVEVDPSFESDARIFLRNLGREL